VNAAPGARPDPAPGVEELGRAELSMAVLRVAVVPLLAVGENAVNHPPQHGGLFGPLLGAFAAWALVLLAVHARAAHRHGPPLRGLGRIEPVVDLAAIAALAFTSGGAFSQARLAFFALPLVAAFRLRPALTAAWAAVATAAYVMLALVHPATRTRADFDLVVVQALYLTWAGAGAVVLSALLRARDRRIRAAADERGRLVARALSAEDRERRRLAEVLHDDAVQNLLLARHELHDHHRRHDEDSYRRADGALAATVDQLRSEIFELHPYVLDHAGLRAALTALAETAARRSGAQVDVEVDDAGPGAYDQLVLSLARELLANAAEHARARHIVVRVARDGAALVLVVRDDGDGFARDRREAAVAAGHIGLATSAERAAAVGGSFDIASAPGAGTTITVRLPASDPSAA
jgi:two-component system NarL family sensor kinase